ncbi:hypothetical protein B0I31_10273 [Saccharothrix carnea]|uniref:Uncharacterized protein n=1 Tax=Saccharothrix carnea TaxID=1280637 RepID=A0A2P8IF50_SACCR|nr:hypothetical protein B0I31_10273 [Saccharothrix carnea]
MTTTTAPVDWRAVPGYPVFYRPDVIEPGLRGLAQATGTVAAAQATASLDGGAFVHGHSGAAMPAAASAAPFLLDVRRSILGPAPRTPAR